MRRKLILHIGFPKTGTTALQLFLRRNAKLLARYGINYPDIGYAFHHRLAHFFLKNQGEAEVQRVFTLYLAGSEKIRHVDKVGTVPQVDAVRELSFLQEQEFETTVISTETFVWYWRDIDYELVGRALADFDVTVLAYLRPQPEFVEGAYRQAVQGEENSITQGFAEYMAQYDWSYADYFQILEKWSDLFGRDRVQVVPYERSAMVGNDIRTDFLMRIGAPLRARYNFNIRFDNTSHTAPTINLLRWLNLRNIPAKWRFKLRKRLALFDRLVQRRGDWSFFSPEEIKALEQRFAESNTAVARTYLGREQLFSPRKKFREKLPENPWEIIREVAAKALTPGRAKKPKAKVDLAQVLEQCAAKNCGYAEQARGVLRTGLPLGDLIREVLSRVSTTPLASFPPLKLIQADGCQDMATFRNRMDSKFRELARRAALQGSSRVLEVGCGCGGLALPFVHALCAGRFYGVDHRPEGLAWCREHLAPLNVNASFHLLPAPGAEEAAEAPSLMPFIESDSLDFVYSLSAFSQLVRRDCTAYLKEVARTLSLSGVAYVTCRLVDKYFRAHAERTGRNVNLREEATGCFIGGSGQDAFVGYSPEAWRDMLAECGLEVVSWELGSWANKPGGLAFRDTFIVRRFS